MSYSSTVKTDCILWYAELKSPIKVQRKFRTKYGKNEKPPSGYCMKIWLENFKKTGSIKSKKIRSNSVDRQRIAQCLRDEPQQSLSRVANQFDISNSAVRTALKSSGFKRYRPQVVHALKNDDKTVRVTFAETMLDKINQSPRFLEMILFSDEAIFPLEGGVNKHNSSYWSEDNPHWIVEKSLNSPKIIVWAAVGFRSHLIEGNVDGDAYLRLLNDDFFPVLSTLQNQSELLLMQDGAPPHWAQRVRDWLNLNLPQKWIGRGNSRDTDTHGQRVHLTLRP